jgi:hypothetical protein
MGCLILKPPLHYSYRILQIQAVVHKFTKIPKKCFFYFTIKQLFVVFPLSGGGVNDFANAKARRELFLN